MINTDESHMEPLIIELQDSIRDLFIKLRNENKQREDYKVAIKNCYLAAAERILYLDHKSSKNQWELIDQATFSLLRHHLWNHLLNMQLAYGCVFNNENMKIDVLVTNTVVSFYINLRTARVSNASN